MSDDPYAWPGLDRTQPLHGGSKDKPERMPESPDPHSGDKFWISSDGKITYFSGNVRFDPGTGQVMPVSEFRTTGDAGIFLTAAIGALEPGLYRKCPKCDAFAMLEGPRPDAVRATITVSLLCERCT